MSSFIFFCIKTHEYLIHEQLLNLISLQIFYMKYLHTNNSQLLVGGSWSCVYGRDVWMCQVSSVSQNNLTWLAAILLPNFWKLFLDVWVSLEVSVSLTQSSAFSLCIVLSHVIHSLSTWLCLSITPVPSPITSISF